jgi:hypothetical protein|tara:strand:+ start:15286 stop:15723 length:438 start_codon:yes stop_codon:yes gene_type:complete
MQNAIKELEQLTITSAAKGFLTETSKWCKFLSILGFVGLGLLLLSSFFINTIYSNMSQASAMPFNLGIVMTIVYVLIIAIYIFPIYYLYQFSVQLKKALISKDDETLASAFEMLKSHYKFTGVFSIIMLSIYVLAGIVGLMGAIV